MLQSSCCKVRVANLVYKLKFANFVVHALYWQTLLGNLVWGPFVAQSQKGFRYECDYPGIIALQPYINTSTTTCFQGSSIHDTKMKLELSIFPNPTSSEINIELEYNQKNSVTIGLYNFIGQEIFTKELNQSSGFLKEKISLTDLSDGMYFVKIMDNSRILSSNKISYIK